MSLYLYDVSDVTGSRKLYEPEGIGKPGEKGPATKQRERRWDYMKVKIAKMQELFGVTDKRTCIECRNLCRKVAGGRTVYKCGVYGITNSTASDWQAGYPACGMYNQGYTGTPVIEIVKHQSRTEPDEQLPGQVSIDEYLNDLPEEEKEPAGRAVYTS